MKNLLESPEDVDDQRSALTIEPVAISPDDLGAIAYFDWVSEWQAKILALYLGVNPERLKDGDTTPTNATH